MTPNVGEVKVLSGFEQWHGYRRRAGPSEFGFGAFETCESRRGRKREHRFKLFHISSPQSGREAVFEAHSSGGLR